MHKVEKKDDQRLVLAIIIIPAVSLMILLTGPLMVGQMVVEHGFANDLSGYIISAELAGMAVATLPAYYWLFRLNTARMAMGALILAAILNGISAILTLNPIEGETLLLLRFLTGLPCGSLMVICLKTIAQFHNVDRGYALHTLGQLVAYSISAAILPHLFAVSGLYIAYILFSLQLLLAIPLSRYFVQIKRTKTSLNDKKTGVNWLGLCGLLAVFFFYVSLLCVWTYVERIGVGSGIESAEIGYILSLTALLGIVGAGFATWISGKISPLPMIVIGMAMMLLSVWMFIGFQTVLHYIAAASIAKLTWTFVLPFIFGVISIVDYSGRMVTNLFMVIAVGMATGPALGAALIGADKNYDLAVTISTYVMLMSSVLIIFVAYKSHAVLNTSQNKLNSLYRDRALRSRGDWK